VSFGKEFSGDTAHEVVVTTTALQLIGLGDGNEAVGKPIKLKVLVPKAIEGTQEEELVSSELDANIVGVIESKDELSLAYIPIQYLISIGFEPDYSAAKVKVSDEALKEYSVARIKVEDESQLPEVRKQIESMGYQVDSVADTVGQIDKIFLIFEIIVAGFGAIAMFVASIGSLNTLTVSLLERTREIGLMKSLGATSGDIYRLFLAEAIVIGMTGGVLGVGLGYVAGQGVNYGINMLAKRLGGEPVDIFLTPILLVGAILLMVFFVSLFTGLYPARRAAKINPLDALRYE
jgi:putative ABC transport system permease protein